MDRIRYENQVHKQIMEAAFPSLYAAKKDANNWVTFADLNKWAHKHSLTNGRLLWDEENADALVRFNDWQGMTETYTFETLIKLIQEEK